jgi:hypothetical protein
MCFSATASFTAGTVLLGLGALTFKSARNTRELPFAAIPFLFAIQQLSEGGIWMTVGDGASLLNVVLTYVYSFFSHVLWPVYVPLAVFLMEPPGPRRKMLAAFLAAGLAVGAYLLYFLIAYPIVARASGGHIEYVSPHFFAAVAMSLYLLSTTTSPLFSTYGTVKVFGIVAVISFAGAYFFYAVWFISVWCFLRRCSVQWSTFISGGAGASPGPWQMLPQPGLFHDHPAGSFAASPTARCFQARRYMVQIER